MLIKRKILLIFFILLIPLVIGYEASSPSYQIEMASNSIAGNSEASSTSYTIKHSGNPLGAAGAFTSTSYKGMTGVLKYETAVIAITGTCGDGNVDPGEQCDDNNNVNGDGCSSTCQIEGGSPPPVPEFSDYAIALLLLTVVGGFVAMRRRQE